MYYIPNITNAIEKNDLLKITIDRDTIIMQKSNYVKKIYILFVFLPQDRLLTGNLTKGEITDNQRRKGIPNYCPSARANLIC